MSARRLLFSSHVQVITAAAGKFVCGRQRYDRQIDTDTGLPDVNLLENCVAKLIQFYIIIVPSTTKLLNSALKCSEATGQESK